jgi:molecular chaperone Hsp33
MRLPFLGGQKVAGTIKDQNTLWDEFLQTDFHSLDSKILGQTTKLQTRDIEFRCRCQKDNFVAGLMTLSEQDRHDIFKDQSTVTLQCDYCLKEYAISKDDVFNTFH